MDSSANRRTLPKHQLSRKGGIPGYGGRKPILARRKLQKIVLIIVDGKDVTPKPLNPEIFKGKEKQICTYDSDKFSKTSDSVSNLSSMPQQSTIRFRQDMDRGTSYRGGSNYSSNYLDVLVTYDSSQSSSSAEVSEEVKVQRKVKKGPKRVTLILKETSTFLLLDLPSYTELKDTDEAHQVEAENERYEYITVGKGKNRKIVQAESQTRPMVMKTRSTSYERTKTQVGSAFVSVYDMYDTFQDVKEESEEEESDSIEDVEEGNVKLDEAGSVESYKLSSDEKYMSKLMKNPKFLEACIVIERLLANNYFNEQQKIFRGLTETDPFRDDIQYKYRLNLLWTFANNDTVGRSVNSCDWNPVNKDILAVGYGKFFFHDDMTGLVLIWNIKNPVQPERKFSFQKSVTSLCFSNKNPVLLAIGFYHGSVKVINISSRELMVIGENVPTFEPAWHIIWQYGRNEKQDQELVTVTFDDGRICAYNVQRKLEMSQLMRVGKADGKLKGYDAMKKCSSLTIPVSRYASALFVRPHPLDPSIYFVGTNEGTIHKCSLNYLSQHLDVFLAHEGSVHELKFSPFFKQISATCGDDWNTRIWAEGISEPILTFSGFQSVQGLDWSPIHSTILVVIRAQFIEVWDMQRKVYEPQSTTCSPTNSRNTVVQFTHTGRCIIVGDIDGNVHLFSLEDMPFPPFFQENLLCESLARALVTNPQLVNNIKKIKRASKLAA